MDEGIAFLRKDATAFQGELKADYNLAKLLLTIASIIFCIVLHVSSITHTKDEIFNGNKKLYVTKVQEALIFIAEYVIQHDIPKVRTKLYNLH